jgi:hypothetical protein
MDGLLNRFMRRVSSYQAITRLFRMTRFQAAPTRVQITALRAEAPAPAARRGRVGVCRAVPLSDYQGDHVAPWHEVRPSGFSSGFFRGVRVSVVHGDPPGSAAFLETCL